MKQYSVLCVGGTWEPFPTDTAMTPVHGMLAEVTKHLDPNRFRPRWVPYAAKYANDVSYADSLADGRARTLKAIRDDWNPVILLGYSQGAQIVGDLMRDIVNGQLHGEPWATELEVSATGLLADPSRHSGQLGHVGLDATYGIAGERWINGRVWSMAAPGDPICRLPRGNAMRSIADLTKYATDRDPYSWARSAMEGAKRAQPWWDIANWSSWGGAVNALRGYMPFDPIVNPGGGRHTVYGIEKCPGTQVTYTQRLAELIGGLPR